MELPLFLRRLKGRLEAPERGAATFTVTLRDFLVVSHAVPAERARPHVPAGLPLDTRPDPQTGESLAFVQTTCFFNDNLHWSPLGEGGPGLSYHQSTYRILVKRGERRGAFFLRTFAGTSESFAAQRAIAREVDYAPFVVHVAGDPVQARYEAYTVRAIGERGQTALDVRAGTIPVSPLFTDGNDAAFFLTQREEGYFHAAARGVSLMPVEHAPMHPVSAELVAARLTLWTDELNVLEKDDLLRPVSVLIQPSIVFTTFPPRPVSLSV
jgi:hypothetical protein